MYSTSFEKIRKNLIARRSYRTFSNQIPCELNCEIIEKMSFYERLVGDFISLVIGRGTVVGGLDFGRELLTVHGLGEYCERVFGKELLYIFYFMIMNYSRINWSAQSKLED